MRWRWHVNKAAVLPRCEGDTGPLHPEQALLINHRIFTSSDLIKDRWNSHAHTTHDRVNLSPTIVPSFAHKHRGGGAAVTLQDPKQRGVIVLSPLKQNKLRSDTQHMSFDIKPYGRGAERAIYLKVLVVIGHKNVIGLLTKKARPLRKRRDPEQGDNFLSFQLFKYGCRRNLLA